MCYCSDDSAFPPARYRAMVALVAAAIVPHPPALLPGVTGLPIAEIEDVRAHAVAAVRSVVAAAPDVIVAICAGATTARWAPAAPSAEGYVGGTASATRLPLGLEVIAALLPATVAAPLQFHCVDSDATPDTAASLGVALAAQAPRVGFVVAGDGSARRGLKAPGYADERAAPFDAAAHRALAGGDADALLDLDVTLAAELLVAGRSAWQVLAGAARGAAVTATLEYAGDPFGVWYAVGRWTLG